MKQFSYARSMAVLQPVLEEAVANGVAPDLNDEQDEQFTRICGINPGIVEAFATPEARDARLGPFRGDVTFVPVTFDEVATAGFAARNVAVGPRIGEPGFEEVVRAIAREVSAEFLHCGEPIQIIVGRVAYDVDQTGRVIAWTTVYAEVPSDAVCRATAAWLQQVIGPLLNPHQKPAAND